MNGYILIIVGLVITNAVTARFMWRAQTAAAEALTDALKANDLLDHYRDRADGFEAQLERTESARSTLSDQLVGAFCASAKDQS